MQELSTLGQPCPTCEHPMDEGECGNPVCGMYTRQFRRNSSIAARTGILQARIDEYKFQGRTRWADIFGRVLVGHLEANAAEFGRYELIVASPVFTGPGGRAVDHIRAILRAAEAAAPGAWPIDLEEPAAVIRTASTERFTGKRYAQRRDARPELRRVLAVPHPERIRGLRIIVVDDVFTSGTTLDEVARALRGLGGAREVIGISLARQVRRPTS